MAPAISGSVSARERHRGVVVSVAINSPGYKACKKPDVGTPSSQSPPSTPGTTLCGRCGLRVLRGLVTLLPSGAAVSGPRSLRFADLIETPLVPPALERRGQPQRQNLV